MPFTVPSWGDPVVARATGLIGGPVGRYAVLGARGALGALTVLVLLSTVMMSLGVWQKGHCLMKGWTTPDQFWRACYSDLPVVHASSPLAGRGLPWEGAIPSNQPPLSGLLMWLVSLVSPTSGPGVGSQQAVFVIGALVCLILLLGAVVAAVALSPRRPWQAAHLAASPVLVTLALLSYDLLGVALTMLALLAWRRERSWLAGVLLGLAVLVRPFPLVFLLAIVIVAQRRGETFRAGQVVVGAALGALAVVVPLTAVEPQALTAARDWLGQDAGYGALQMIPPLVGLHALPGVAVAIALCGWVLAVVLGVVVERRQAWRGVRVHQVAALMMAVVVLTAPSLSVQSGLWMLPFLALSGRRWWEHLVWAGAETLHFVATWLHIAFASDAGRGLPPEAYALVILLRVAAWVWLLWRIWEEPARPRAQGLVSRPSALAPAPAGPPAV
ncbi:glycosyltransferase 87 family protein [Ornithinimicrobium panacihumi]|uniref:glycosyltransferase 87 family protein n=1 Tax=Ornithinimicrobium panacihumi TaxID=2008449 RepID=UPI003F8AA985